MADNTDPRFGKSPEEIAFLLCDEIQKVEGRKIISYTSEKIGDKSSGYRKYLLDLYAECLDATTARRLWEK